jgi:hypothetical protein
MMSNPNPPPPSPALRDRRVTLRDEGLAQKLGDLVLVGKRFAFIKPGWMEQAFPGMDQWGFSQAAVGKTSKRSAIVFLGDKEVTLPGATVAGQPFAKPDLVSLTSDKALYRVGKDTVRLLIASPQRPKADLKLTLRLSGNHYASYNVTLDEYGLCLRALAGLPEGEYEATLEGTEVSATRFEVAEYRLAPLTADLVQRTMEGTALSFTLLLRAFGQPFTGDVEIELQERGQRVGKRQQLKTDAEGRCSGKVELTGAGPYTLNVIAGERTATVALKGSEQERREAITISELGKVQELSLLPLPGSEVCRGLYIAERGTNTTPFLVSEVIGEKVNVVARAGADLLRVVMVSPATGEVTEALQENVAPGTELSIKTPAPYGMLLVGAFINGKAWEGWCAVVRPSELSLEITTPAKAKPGERVKLTLRTNQPDRVVPVQVIVKDQRLIAPSDPQVELAARIKAALPQDGWHPGEPGANLYAAGYEPPIPPPGAFYARAMTLAGGAPMPMAAPMLAPQSAPKGGGSLLKRFADTAAAPVALGAMVAEAATDLLARDRAAAAAPEAQPAATATLTPIRIEFPEVIYNSIVYVKGQEEVTVKLGDALTVYSIEAFALDKLDWVREEAQLEAQLPVYGELVLSPFVFPGDQVLGTLHVGAASGRAWVEVQRDGEPVALWVDGRRLAPDEEVKSDTAVRFPVQPGAFTAIVRDAVSGEADVSERYVTPPGKMRHLVKRTRLLTAGEAITKTEEKAKALRVLPGLERPFEVFVEGACKYPHG